MQVTSLEIADVLLLTPVRHGDDRGFFSETYNARVLQELGVDGPFVQDNHSLSAEKYVLRGLHFQTPPTAQGKLVRVSRGAIFDVAVDLRAGSPTYRRYVSAILSAENWQQLWVPKGFAHGFLTLETNTEVQYKVTDYYAPECDAGVAWNDPALAVQWPLPAGCKPILSAKDQRLPTFADLPAYF